MRRRGFLKLAALIAAAPATAAKVIAAPKKPSIRETLAQWRLRHIADHVRVATDRIYPSYVPAGLDMAEAELRALASVQPMSEAVGEIFYLDFKHNPVRSGGPSILDTGADIMSDDRQTVRMTNEQANRLQNAGEGRVITRNSTEAVVSVPKPVAQRLREDGGSAPPVQRLEG